MNVQEKNEAPKKGRLQTQREDDAIDEQLSHINNYFIEVKRQNNRAAQERVLLHSAGLELAAYHKMDSSVPQKVLDLCKIHARDHIRHTCHHSTCEMKILQPGDYRDPLNPNNKVTSDGFLYLCYKIEVNVPASNREIEYMEDRKKRESDARLAGYILVPNEMDAFFGYLFMSNITEKKPGSFNLHWCDLNCTLIEMGQTGVGKRKDGTALQKEEAGICPISLKAKKAQTLSVPSYNEMKLSHNKLNQMSDQDLKNYLGNNPGGNADFSLSPEDAIEKARKLFESKISSNALEKKNGRKPSSRKKNETNKKKEERFVKFKDIFNALTSKLSQTNLFYETKYLPLHNKALVEIKKEINSKKKLLPKSKQMAIYLNMIWKGLPTMTPAKAFTSTDRLGVICERIERIWHLISTSPYVMQSANKTGNTKRNKPLKPVYNSICAACIFAMSEQGIFIEYERIQGVQLALDSFCILGKDPEINECAIDPDKVESALSQETCKFLGLSNKTYRLAMCIIKECMGSWVAQYAREAEDSINNGSDIDEVVKTYILKCENLYVA
jgi:hypothetical protein